MSFVEIRSYKIYTIKDVYNSIVTIIRSPAGETSGFSITVRFDQGVTLSLYLFALVMDELTTRIQFVVLWCMMFAINIVLVDETSRGVNVS